MKDETRGNSTPSSAQRAYWVARYRASGMARRRFAQEPGLRPAQLHYWVYHPRPVSTGAVPVARVELRSALARVHYLGYRSPVGENLQYELRDAAGRWLARLVVGAAAWHCAARDQWIGWTPAQRERGLFQIANHSRLLILPWVRVRHLASWLLGQVTARIAEDWQAKYGHRVSLLETFVERERFTGTSYRAGPARPTRQPRRSGEGRRRAGKGARRAAVPPRSSEAPPSPRATGTVVKVLDPEVQGKTARGWQWF